MKCFCNRNSAKFPPPFRRGTGTNNKKVIELKFQDPPPLHLYPTHTVCGSFFIKVGEVVEVRWGGGGGRDGSSFHNCNNYFNFK